MRWSYPSEKTGPCHFRSSSWTGQSSAIAVLVALSDASMRGRHKGLTSSDTRLPTWLITEIGEDLPIMRHTKIGVIGVDQYLSARHVGEIHLGPVRAAADAVGDVDCVPIRKASRAARSG
jgi:hypothetical protein